MLYSGQGGALYRTPWRLNCGIFKELILEKDKENQYDDEAIKVMVPTIVRKAM
ncbi:MAG: hypothetical protein PUD31_05260 [Solobacterium sp.]|nr:hypothetical protein [Solobacterium sp.]